MRAFVALILAGIFAFVSPAFAHCGKPHPDGKDKDKTQTSHPAPRPE